MSLSTTTAPEGGECDVDVGEVVEAVRAIYSLNTPNERRLFYTQAIETLKEEGPPGRALTLAFQLVLHDDRLVRQVGWNIIEHAIRYRWPIIYPDMRLRIRTGVMEHVSLGRHSLEAAEDLPLKTALCRCVVLLLMERDWLQHWPQLFDQFEGVVLGKEGAMFSQCQMVFMVLRRLAEDVVTLCCVEDSQRRRDLAAALNAQMGRILRMTAERIGACLAATANGGGEVMEGRSYTLLAKAGIELLGAVVEWTLNKTLEEQIDRIVDVLCAYLQTEAFGIYEEAAKCLWRIASRKCQKSQEAPIVMSLFRNSPMETILRAASLAADVSASSEEHYKYLKALCDLLCALGVHLSEVWNSATSPPPNFALYLSAITAFFLHPSIYIRAETAYVIATFSSHVNISRNLDFINCITALLPQLPSCMEKSGTPSSSDGLTSHYSRMDYEDDEDFNRDYLAMRDRCCRIVKENTAHHPRILLRIVQQWTAQRCVAEPSKVRPDEWEMMKRFLNTLVSAHLQLGMGQETKLAFLALFDAVLARIASLPEGESSTHRTCNDALSILSALFPIFNDQPDRIPMMLKQLRLLLILPNPNNEDSDLLSLKRHCITLMLKLISSFPDATKPYAEVVFNLVVEVARYVSLLQWAHLVQVLGALSNLAAEQGSFLKDAICQNVEYLLSAQFLGTIASPSSFLTAIGLASMAPASDVEAQGSTFYENRLLLKSHLTAIEGILQQVNAPNKGGNPLFPLLREVLPGLFQMAKCLNAIYRPESVSLIHPSYGRRGEVLEMSTTERQTLFYSASSSSSSNNDVQQQQLENGQADGPLLISTTHAPSSSSSSSSSSQRTPSVSITYLRRFIAETTELLQTILGMVGSKLGADFYSLPEASDLCMSTISSIEYVPDFRVRFWMRRTWYRLVCHCPPERAPSVTPLTRELTRHLHVLVPNRWATVRARGEEVEPSEEELLLESMTSVLSREYATFLRALVQGVDPFPQRQPKKDPNELIAPLALNLLGGDKLILEQCVSSLGMLINCPDTQAALKCVPVAGVLVGTFSNAFDEQMAGFSLVHVIKGLQIHGSDEVAAGPLLALVFQLYSTFRPRYPTMLEILRQVPGGVEGQLAQFDERVMGMVSSGEKMSDKAKRELVKKILKPVIGQNLSDQHKRPKARTASQQNRANAAAASLAAAAAGIGSNGE